MHLLNITQFNKKSQNQLLTNQDYQVIKELNCILLKINYIKVYTNDILILVSNKLSAILNDNHYPTQIGQTLQFQEY